MRRRGLRPSSRHIVMHGSASLMTCPCVTDSRPATDRTTTSRTGLDSGSKAEPTPVVGHGNAGEAVDVLGAVGVVEQSSVAVVGDHRLDAFDEPGHDVVAVLFLHTHGIDHLSADARIGTH